MALIATLLAFSFTAQPGHLVLGRDAGADLTVHAPAGATVTLSSSVGTVSAPRHEGEVWTARFIPPALHSPSVAIILLQVDADGARELAWLSLPLSGADTMEIETRPGSSVMAVVAGTTVGPVIADKSGTARLSMVVPPGVAMGTLHITDKLGNKSEKPLDLEPPPFSRVRMASRSQGATTVSPAELEIFVIKPDGTPDDDAKVELMADDGEAIPVTVIQTGPCHVIGTRTAGSLMGGSSPPALIDGGSRSVPAAAFYEPGGSWVVEGGPGVLPDIEVLEDPARMADGQDPQLDAAIELMQAELKQHPPVHPHRPPSPDR